MQIVSFFDCLLWKSLKKSHIFGEIIYSIFQS